MAEFQVPFCGKQALKGSQDLVPIEMEVTYLLLLSLNLRRLKS